MAWLSLCGVLVVAMPVHAQDAPASDALRIEQLRDQAGVADAVAELAATEETEAVEVPLSANEALPLGAGEGDLFSGGGASSEAGSMGDGWLLSTLAALGVVLALVFGIRWMLRRGGVVSTAAPQGGVVEVLSRTTVAPRSHVVLMRVGTRILVVSDSPAGMRTLSTVQDAEEVAELLGAIDSAKPTSMTQNFGSVMKKLSGQWSSEDEALDAADDRSDDMPVGPGPVVDEAAGALSRVRGRLAALSDSGGRA